MKVPQDHYRRPKIDPLRVFYRYWIRDHAFVRALMPNFYRIDDAVFRSGHPSFRRLAKARRLGLRSVLSLRGDPDCIPNMIERDACSRLGLYIHFVPLRTAVLPDRETLLQLVRTLREIPKPVLVHCKSGADRTGLAITIYRHVILGEPLEVARSALSWRYGHFRNGKAGVIHALLDAYAKDHSQTGIGFEDWVTTSYDPGKLQAAHSTARRG